MLSHQKIENVTANLKMLSWLKIETVAVDFEHAVWPKIENDAVNFKHILWPKIENDTVILKILSGQKGLDWKCHHWKIWQTHISYKDRMSRSKMEKFQLIGRGSSV